MCVDTGTNRLSSHTHSLILSLTDGKVRRVYSVPSLPAMPTPTRASWIIPTSLAPAPTPTKRVQFRTTRQINSEQAQAQARFHSLTVFYSESDRVACPGLDHIHQRCLLFSPHPGRKGGGWGVGLQREIRENCVCSANFVLAPISKLNFYLHLILNIV